MRDNLDALNQPLVAQQAHTAQQKHQAAEVFAYVVAKIFPLLAAGTFASLTDFKKPESIALSSMMLSSTALSILADLGKLSERAKQFVDIVSGVVMSGAVGLMSYGAIEEYKKSVQAFMMLVAMACFGSFALGHTSYSALRFSGCVQDRKPGMELTTALLGLIGSGLFLWVNTENFIAAKDANKPLSAPVRMMIMPALFVLATAFNVALAARAVCAVKKPEESSRVEVVADADDTRTEVSMAPPRVN